MNCLYLYTRVEFHNQKQKLMQGYNDDLVMSYSIALWVRDTALRLQKDKNDQQWQQ